MKTTFSDTAKGMIIGFILSSPFLAYIVALIVIATCFEDWAKSHAGFAALASIASGFVWLGLCVAIYHTVHYFVFRKAKQSIREDAKARSLATFIKGCRNESL